MLALKSKFFLYFSVVFVLVFSFYPSTEIKAKTINLGTVSDTVSVPGTFLNSKLAGVGNRCLYVDASGNVLVKGFDCGSATGGDNLGDHSATQNIKLNTFWLSGDAGNEGIFVNSAGGVGVNTNSIAAGLSLLVSGNLQSTGSVTLSGPIYAGGGNRMITVDNSGVLGAAAIPVDTDIYWNGGTGGGFNAATGRTSLGLGALATLSSVANAQITDVAWSKITGFPTACSAGQYVSAVGGTLTCSTPAGGVSGSGTANYISKWATGSTLGDSVIYDNGTNVGIGTSSPGAKLDVVGQIKLSSGGATDKIFSNNTNGLILESQGNPYGTVRLTLQNVGGMNGALFHNTALDMVDFGFMGNSGVFQNIRFEKRPSMVYSGNSAGQFEIGPADSESLFVGAVSSGFRFGNVGIGTTTPATALSVSGGNAFINDAVITSGTPKAAVTKEYLDSSLTAFNTENNLWKLNGANLYASTTAWNVGIGTTNPVAKLDLNGSLLTNSSVTLSMLAGGGTRLVTVDNSGVLAAITPPDILPAGQTGNTLYYDSKGWAAGSNIFNDGSNVSIALGAADACTAALGVNGEVHSSSLYLSQVASGSCYPGTRINASSLVLNSATTFTFQGATTYGFDNNITTSGRVVANSGFGVGINTGVSTTVIVKGSTGINCSLVFNGGILVAETCP